MDAPNQPPTSKSSRTDGNQGFRPFIKPLQTQNIAQQNNHEKSNETSFDSRNNKMDNYNPQVLRGTAFQHHLDDTILTRSSSVPHISRDEFQQRNYHKVSSQV